ncbi:MAG: hypothetical protein ACK5SA_03715 [Planctomycetota bacterium]
MIPVSTPTRTLALPLLLLAFACGWIALQDQPAGTHAVPLPQASFEMLTSQLPESTRGGTVPTAASSQAPKGILPEPAETIPASVIPASTLSAPAEVVGTALLGDASILSAAETSTDAGPPLQSVLESPQPSLPAAVPPVQSRRWASTTMGKVNSPSSLAEFPLPESSGEEEADLPRPSAGPAPAAASLDFSGLQAAPLLTSRDSPIPIGPGNFAAARPPAPAESPQPRPPSAPAALSSAALPSAALPSAVLPSATSNFRSGTPAISDLAAPATAAPAPGTPGTSGSGQLTNNPAKAYLLESLKPPRTTDGCEVPPTIEDFSAPPTNYDSFNPTADMQIYQGKRLYGTQRPLLELGRPWYQLGQLPPPQSWLGLHNPVSQQFLVFGDFRTAVAANQLGGNSQSLLAWQSNLFFDWRLTGTERFHFNITPNTQGADSSRYLFDDDDFISEFNADVNFGFFEGDVGAILGGFTNKTLPFDMPIALGVMPLVIQNGVWLDDAFLGAAATLPAQNSPLLDISNYDITFFAGWDKLNSPAFGNDDNAAKLYGVASWWEALNGYIEADYAFVEDRDSVRDRSYHNIGLAYTRRFGHLLSNSTRVLVNAGQSTLGGENTADGVLLLSENSLITANPSTILPYFNLFAGFDRPQSVGRAGIAGGVLRNTGILFESDNLTGYPTLDATANQTYGMALGLSLMPQTFSQQLVLEGAMLGVMGDDLGRNAAAAQRGVGFRYQLPLNNSMIFRVDGMYGFLAETEDISGLRVELRRKF